ncbi:hypothetical protein BSKO_11132 [Bryopsis sp. KO-2023]|nr:hypothetical protein BSKO_11132 [Bryopsis sp. KO-2023]
MDSARWPRYFSKADTKQTLNRRNGWEVLDGYETASPPQRGSGHSKRFFASLVVFASLTLVAIVASGRGDANKCLYDCTPYEVHLSLMSDPSSVRVTWRTNTEDCGTLVLYQKARRAYRWGTDLLSYFGWSIPRAFAVESRHSSNDVCGSPANETSFSLNMYSAVLTGLEPGVGYIYMLSGGCDEYEFTAPLGVGPQVADFEFVAFGDMGTGPGQNLMVAALGAEAAEHDPRFVFLNGDLAYAHGDNGVWEEFMDQIESVASHVPWMVSTGNHEYAMSLDLERDHWGLEPFRPKYAPEDYGLKNDGGGECGTQLAWRFPMLEEGALTLRSTEPPKPGAAFPPFWYAFEYGAAHFIALSSEHDLAEGSLQRIWLEKDLASVDRCKTPFVVVFHHRAFKTPPFWPTTFEREFLAPVVEDLFTENGVDLIVGAHQHLYYRGCAFGEGSCEDEGIMEVVIGTGGHQLTEVPDGLENEYIPKLGYGRFTVGAKDIIFEFVEAEGRDTLDSFTLGSKELCSQSQEWR